MWKPGDRILLDGVPGEVTMVLTPFSAYYHLSNGTCGECLNKLLREDRNPMARPRKTDAEKKNASEAKVQNKLLEAAKFCAPGYKENGESYSKTAMIYGGYLTTYTGIVMFGHPIELTFQALPDFAKFYNALKTTDGQSLQVTQLDMGRLSIKGKGFKTVVPCETDPRNVARPGCDNPVGMLDSRMREAFEVVKQFMSKTGENILDSACLMDNGRVVATDRKLIVAYTHNLGFPRLTVPADFIEAVLKCTKPLVSFGFTEGQSLTFYFDDGAFIRTQLYSEAYPDVDSVWPANWNGMQQIPDNFFDALDRIAPFIDKHTEGTFAHMKENRFTTHASDEVGTVVDCPGLLAVNAGIDVDRFRKIKGKVTHVDFKSDKNKARFLGENIFGLCVQAVFYEQETPDPVDRGEVPALETEEVDVGSQRLDGTYSFHPPAAEVEIDDGDPVDEPEEDEDVELAAPPVASGWARPTA